MIGALFLIPALSRYLLRPEQIIEKHQERHGDAEPAEKF